jgi:serine-type D-Ala-D-Ala carboxypeptidase (penicillin-binding protein 5/6)
MPVRIMVPALRCPGHPRRPSLRVTRDGLTKRFRNSPGPRRPACLDDIVTDWWVWSRSWQSARYLTGVVVAVMAAVLATSALAAPSAAWAMPAGAGAAQLNFAVRGGDLVDASDGVQLWAKDLDVRRPMGSITKVMTALVVLRAGKLNRKIRVTKAAVRYVSRNGASSAGLIAGDVLTARQLLAAMLIPSGCDAAYLLATAYGPGRPAFIAKMNAMAVSLGMTSTHFSSFDGMPYPTEHSTYSTPADLIRLGEQAMRVPLFRQIVAQRRYGLRDRDGHHAYLWIQTNKLIGSYRGAIGIKTGSTDAAGNCLLFEARRGKLTLIGVVLHARPTSNPGSAIVAARRVLNWGFSRAPSGPALRPQYAAG